MQPHLSRGRWIKQVNNYEYRVLRWLRYLFSLPAELPDFEASEPELPDEAVPLSPDPFAAESPLLVPSFDEEPDPLRA
jgi:hypothetical protein